MIWRDDNGNKFTDGDLIRVLLRLGMAHPAVVVQSKRDIIYRGLRFARCNKPAAKIEEPEYEDDSAEWDYAG